MSDLTQLIAAVRGLTAGVDRNEAALSNVARRQDRQRFGLTLTVVGLVFDLVLSGVLLYQHQQQTCFNGRSRDFFAAEHDKVAGQVAGLQQIKHGNGPAGFDQFIRASRLYLVRIGHISESC